MLLRKIVVGCVSLGFVLGCFQSFAASATGTVFWYFTTTQADGSIYTFVNIKKTGGGSTFCYDISNNTAYATIFAAKQITGSDVTVHCSETSKITQVAN